MSTSPGGSYSVSTPEEVTTRLGTFRFGDGIPTHESAEALYDQLDFHHGIDAYLNGLPAVSLAALRQGFLDAGVNDNDVLVFSGLMDAASLFLTANCDTVYYWTFLDLSAGPLVVQTPPQTLGIVDDMWWRWVTDFGLPGADRGAGGTYLICPPGYDGPLPEGGMFVRRSRTSRVTLLGRCFLDDNDPAPVAAQVKQTLKIYPYQPGGFGSSIATYLAGDGPLGAPGQPQAPRFVEGTGLKMNTLIPTDDAYWNLLDGAVQDEPAEALDLEVAGPIAAIGIAKGTRFRPDERMRTILAEALAAGNALARAITVHPRAAEGFHSYPGTGSRWVNPLFAGGYDFTVPPPLITAEGVKPFPDTGARKLNARTSFFYLATGITPAMCMNLTGIGSQYLAAFLDAAGAPFDGGATYRLTLPGPIPAERFWSVTVYDNQTRSLLDTPQRFPRAGSQSYPTPAAEPGPGGSTTLFFAPQRPDGASEGNWVQTTPGKGWFIILRLYSPMPAFFDKSWRPSEIEPGG